MLVEALAVGVCGTDREIVSGQYGEAPGPDDRLVLGHESLGRVIESGSPKFQPGDLIVGLVRRPDPVPCPACAAGEPDMCLNGQYTERGIKQRHGFARERWRTEADYAVKIDPGLGHCGVLLEPASVLAKAWQHITDIGQRAFWDPHTVLITGAGPIGLFAALFAVERGLDVHVFDRVADGPKPELVRRLGATYHSGDLDDIRVTPQIVLECTGAAPVIVDVLTRIGTGGVVCLTGVSSRGRHIDIDIGQTNRDIVLENNAVFGSVNANARHWQQAAEALKAADRSFLEALITRREPLENFADALAPRPDDVKVVLELAA